MIGLALAGTLAALGHAVCATETTEEGAAAAARHRPDLMIVDLNLLDGSGLPAMARITRAMPVAHLFITGYARPAAMPSAVLLTKPFREADLVQAIERALGPAVLPCLTGCVP